MGAANENCVVLEWGETANREGVCDLCMPSIYARCAQVQLEDMYTGPAIKLEERYAALLVVFVVVLTFSGGMPVLWPIGAATFGLCLLVDKWAFLRLYRLPPM